MRRQLALVIFTLFLSWFATAHEFWLQPQKFRVNVGEPLQIGFKAGENFAGEPWKFTSTRIAKLDWHQQGKAQDIQDLVVDEEKINLTVTPSQTGTHLFVLESTDLFIKLDGEKFNAYLKEDGLDDALQHRTRNNQLADTAREFYSRHSKLLVQVGDKTDDTFRKTTSMPIEIVPLQNPYALTIGDRITFRILFNGKPLFGARVKIFNRHNNRTTLQHIYSQQDGTVETTLSSPGPWLVSVVAMVPSKDPKAQWRSYWGSLTFGV